MKTLSKKIQKIYQSIICKIFFIFNKKIKRRNQNPQPANKNVQQAQNYNNRNTNAPQNALIGSGQKVVQGKFDHSKIYTKLPEIKKEIEFQNSKTAAEPQKYYNIQDNNDLEFYWLDAIEDYKNRSKVHLFGKVKTPNVNNGWSSANLQIKNMNCQIKVKNCIYICMRCI